jgi:hypothetical protein
MAGRKMCSGSIYVEYREVCMRLTDGYNRMRNYEKELTENLWS